MGTTPKATSPRPSKARIPIHALVGKPIARSAVASVAQVPAISRPITAQRATMSKRTTETTTAPIRPKLGRINAVPAVPV